MNSSKLHAGPKKIKKNNEKSRKITQDVNQEKDSSISLHIEFSFTSDTRNIAEPSISMKQTPLFYLPSPSSPSWVLYANSKHLPGFLNLPEHL